MYPATYWIGAAGDKIGVLKYLKYICNLFVA